MATWPNAASPASSLSLTPSSASLTREAWKRHTYDESRSRYLSVDASRIAVLVPAHGSEHLGLDAVPLIRTGYVFRSTRQPNKARNRTRKGDEGLESGL